MIFFNRFLSRRRRMRSRNSELAYWLLTMRLARVSHARYVLSSQMSSDALDLVLLR